MVSAPHLSTEICRSGTPVSVIIITSKRQQQAWQLEQLTVEFLSVIILIIVSPLDETDSLDRVSAPKPLTFLY